MSDQLDELLISVCKNNNYKLSELWDLIEWGEDSPVRGKKWYHVLLGFDVDPTDPLERIYIEEADRNPESIERFRFVLVKDLLKRGADPNVIDGKGVSAIDYARNNAQLDPKTIKALEDN